MKNLKRPLRANQLNINTQTTTPRTPRTLTIHHPPTPPNIKQLQNLAEAVKDGEWLRHAANNISPALPAGIRQGLNAYLTKIADQADIYAQTPKTNAPKP